ncbi:MAG TPA: glycosyltransferase 87 family protein [Chitinophagaceae bacterium]|nr:glycosyltransferase 87 family protein [Chitinophagaceae bacterium]
MTSNRHSFLITARIYYILLFFIAGIFSVIVYNNWQFKKKYFSVDLRNRIVGARVLEHRHGVSPYGYKWKKEDGEMYLDIIDSPQTPVNRNTVTPFFLQLLLPFADNKFQSIAEAWYWIEIISLLLATVFMVWLSKGFINKIWVATIGFIFIGCSTGFKMHNINGQAYIFFAVLMLLLYLLFTKDKNILREALSGLILSILILTRPITVVFLLPYLIRKKWMTIVAVTCCFAVYFILLSTRHFLWLWPDYLNAMNYWSKDYFNPTVLKEYGQIYPLSTIEGSTAIEQSLIWHVSEDSALRGMVHRIFHVKLYTAQLVTASVILVGYFLFMFRKKIARAGIEQLFIVCFIAYLLLEICLPAVRNSYNYVQWLFPLIVIFSNRRFSLPVYGLMILAGWLALGFLKFLPFDLTLAELIFTAICFHYIKSISPIA